MQNQPECRSSLSKPHARNGGGFQSSLPTHWTRWTSRLPYSAFFCNTLVTPLIFSTYKRGYTHMESPRSTAYHAVLSGVKPTNVDFFVNFRTFDPHANCFTLPPSVIHRVSDNTRSRAAARTNPPRAPPPSTTSGNAVSRTAPVPQNHAQRLMTTAPMRNMRNTRRTRSLPRATDATPPPTALPIPPSPQHESDDPNPDPDADIDVGISAPSPFPPLLAPPCLVGSPAEGQLH